MLSVLRRSRPKTDFWLCFGERGCCNVCGLRAKIVMPSVNAHIYLLLARRTRGADGRDYRANYVHAPFPEILSSRALSEPQDSRLQPAKHRVRAM
jgi:hypothetical protein